MKGDSLKAKVLAARVIPNVSPELAKQLSLTEEQKSVALLTSDCDDVTYTALDEATKKRMSPLSMPRVFMRGRRTRTRNWRGEVIGILAGPTPDEVKSGLEQAMYTIEHEAAFVSANEDDSIAYYAHCVSSTGSYLSEGAGIRKGEALAYLIAPPLESMYGLDAALKAADVRLCVLYAPPSETNFGGGLPDRNAVCLQIRV